MWNLFCLTETKKRQAGIKYNYKHWVQFAWKALWKEYKVKLTSLLSNVGSVVLQGLSTNCFPFIMRDPTSTAMTERDWCAETDPFIWCSGEGGSLVWGAEVSVLCESWLMCHHRAGSLLLAPQQLQTLSKTQTRSGAFSNFSACLVLRFTSTLLF